MQLAVTKVNFGKNVFFPSVYIIYTYFFVIASPANYFYSIFLMKHASCVFSSFFSSSLFPVRPSPWVTHPPLPAFPGSPKRRRHGRPFWKEEEEGKKENEMEGGGRSFMLDGMQQAKVRIKKFLIVQKKYL